MSVKIVREIPKPLSKLKTGRPDNNYRERIRADIMEAYECKISKFELVGYETASPSYIATLAREEAYTVCAKTIYPVARKAVKNILLKEEYPEDCIRVATPGRYDNNKIIKVHGVTLPDGVKHVFVEIDFNYLKGFKKELKERAVKDTRERMRQKARSLADKLIQS